MYSEENWRDDDVGYEMDYREDEGDYYDRYDDRYDDEEYCPSCGAVLGYNNRMMSAAHCQRCQPGGFFRKLFAFMFFVEGEDPFDWFL